MIESNGHVVKTMSLCIFIETSLEDNIFEFTIETYEGDAVTVSVDTTDPKRVFMEGGNMEEYSTDVLGHLIYAIDALENT